MSPVSLDNFLQCIKAEMNILWDCIQSILLRDGVFHYLCLHLSLESVHLLQHLELSVAP